MLAFVGALFLTILMIVFVCWFIYAPLMVMGFGGAKGNWPYLVLGIFCSAGVITVWWYLVGTNIHVSFG